LGALSSSGVPPARGVPLEGGGSFAPRCTPASSARASGAGDQESEETEASSVVWHADKASANAQINPRQRADADCMTPTPVTDARAILQVLAQADLRPSLPDLLSKMTSPKRRGGRRTSAVASAALAFLVPFPDDRAGCCATKLASEIGRNPEQAQCAPTEK